MSAKRKTRQDSGRKGGKATLKKHGLEHYRRIGRKGGVKPKEKRQ